MRFRWVIAPLRAEVRGWVSEAQVSIPQSLPDARHPTLGDVEQAVPRLPELHLMDRSEDQSDTVLRLEKPSNRRHWARLRVLWDAEQARHIVTFEDGTEDAVTEMVQAIASVAGPMVLASATSEDLVLVAANGIYYRADRESNP